MDPNRPQNSFHISPFLSVDNHLLILFSASNIDCRVNVFVSCNGCCPGTDEVWIAGLSARTRKRLFFGPKWLPCDLEARDDADKQQCVGIILCALNINQAIFKKLHCFVEPYITEFSLDHQIWNSKMVLHIMEYEWWKFSKDSVCLSWNI